MARDGLAPERLGRVSRRFHTPVTSIVLTCSLMIVFIIALDLALLVKVASAMMLMLFALINLSVLIMRSSGIQNYRPLFRSPLYPWMQLAGIVLSIALVVGMGFVPLVATGCFALAGGLWYVVFVRPRFSKDSALLHMVKSAMDSAIRRSDLENELREIALERDEVVHDRFDRLVQRSEILDIPGAMTSADLFRRSAELLAPKVGLSTEDLHARLERREQETTTVVQRGLAIPHVVVPGEDVFELLIVRCRGGVLFPNRDFPVQTAFVLVGSADQRTFHLQALMAIAHIAGEHGFAQRWLRATAHEDLRDILLLSGRSRLHE
jgi:mannitol/fructose-specific phosphotransferase system IIA component (Ntr-type)